MPTARQLMFTERVSTHGVHTGYLFADVLNLEFKSTVVIILTQVALSPVEKSLNSQGDGNVYSRSLVSLGGPMSSEGDPQGSIGGAAQRSALNSTIENRAVLNSQWVWL